MISISTALIVGAGIVIGLVLGLIGGGGSILTVPLLVYGVGLAPKVAIATSLLVVTLTSLFGMLLHHRNGNVDWRTGISFGLAGMVGAYAGGAAARYLADAVQLVLFALVMMGSGLAMLRRRHAAAPVASPVGRSLARVVGDGMLCGMVTGLVGAGGGFLIVPALAILGGMPMHVAVGTSLLVIAMNCLSALTGYVVQSHVGVDFHAAAIIAACAISGTLLGARLALRVQPQRLQRGFGVFVLLVASILIVVEGSAMAASRLAMKQAPLEALLAGIACVILVPLIVRTLHAGRSRSNGTFPPVDRPT